MIWNGKTNAPEFDVSPYTPNQNNAAVGYWDKKFYDGKFVFVCSKCRRTVQTEQQWCPYCGQHNEYSR